MKKCKYRNERGCCTQVNANRKCKNYISSSKWFDDGMYICDIDEVCKNRSPFGNRYFKIGNEELEALKNGKALYYVDEYGTFIILEVEKKMKVVLVKPGEKPVKTNIVSSLENMQEIVGGYIEAVYPFDDPVALVCNEEGKLIPLKPCRYLCNEDGDIVDIIFGNFFICGLSEDGFDSLTDELAEKYWSIFEEIDRF